MLGVGTAELIDVLVVVPYGNDPHFLVVLHQCADQLELILIYILGFINDQHRFGNPIGLYVAVLDQTGSVLYHSF